MCCGCDQVNANPATHSHTFVHVKTPSSVGTGAEPQSELASPNFGFELVDFPDSLFERHASFDEKLFELRRQAPDQIAVSSEYCVCPCVCAIYVPLSRHSRGLFYPRMIHIGSADSVELGCI